VSEKFPSKPVLSGIARHQETYISYVKSIYPAGKAEKNQTNKA
jgi:hypothetical protein